jgi:hypothetical protein
VVDQIEFVFAAPVDIAVEIGLDLLDQAVCAD